MKRILYRKSSSGFTLVEMLVALTLLSVFLATVYGFFYSTWKAGCVSGIKPKWKKTCAWALTG